MHGKLFPFWGSHNTHSHFKISISIHKDSVAGLKQNSYMFSVIQQTRVIIWDEIPIQYKYNIDTID